MATKMMAQAQVAEALKGNESQQSLLDMIETQRQSELAARDAGKNLEAELYYQKAELLLKNLYYTQIKESKTENDIMIRQLEIEGRYAEGLGNHQRAVAIREVVEGLKSGYYYDSKGVLSKNGAPVLLASTEAHIGGGALDEKEVLSIIKDEEVSIFTRRALLNNYIETKYSKVSITAGNGIESLRDEIPAGYYGMLVNNKNFADDMLGTSSVLDNVVYEVLFSGSKERYARKNDSTFELLNYWLVGIPGEFKEASETKPFTMENIKENADLVMITIPLMGGYLKPAETSTKALQMAFYRNGNKVINIIDEVDDQMSKGATFEGKLYRSVGEGHDPLLIHESNINTSHRYTEPGTGGLYFSTGEKIVDAELKTWNVATNGRDMHSFDVRIDNLLDVSNPNVRNHLGLTLEDITGNSYEITHKIGQYAKQNGYNGIVAPSARADGGLNVILFDGSTINP